MSYKTVNVAPSTYERLRTYKVAGKTFDEVLNALMDRTDPRDLHAAILREHQRRLRRMKRGDFRTLEDLDRALAD